MKKLKIIKKKFNN